MTQLSYLDRHRAALARANEIGLEGIRCLRDTSSVCAEMIRVLEDAEPDMRISVMAVDSERGLLRVVAAPRLPEAYRLAVDGIPIAPGVGSCGAAAAEARKVFVRDILDHENWAPYQELARLSGMRACWSVPILGAKDEVTGTLAMYHAEPCEPTQAQRVLIDQAAKTVGIVLSHAQAHRRLETTLKRLEFATEAGGIGIWDWDAINDRLVWDQRMFALYGVDPTEFSGDVKTFLARVDPDDAERIQREGERALATGQRYQCEFTITRASDGARRRIAEYGAPHIDPQTGDVHLIGVDWDVTEQRDSEEQLRQAQKMEAVGQLTGGVAHDLNNLLTVVLGNLELLEERVSVDATTGAFLSTAIKAATRGACLINQLLAFSRRAVLTPETLDLNRVIRGIEEIMHRSLPETIQVDVVSGADLWPTRLDRNQFENALFNLALNARDAMPAGGRLAIETANSSMAAPTAVTRDIVIGPGRYVVVTISDTGTGMTPEILARSFEPFFTTKPVGKGSGLGLSMVYGFMKQSGGDVRIESSDGGGTCVTLYFPAEVPADPAGGAASESRIARALPGENVLVVEDDAAVREVVVAQLRRLGYQVGAASHGGEAIAMLEADPGYKLLLTDLVMPGGWSGTALAERARAMCPALRVVFMSGYSTSDAIDGPAIGEDDILLTKPIRRSCLAVALRNALDAVHPHPMVDHDS